MEGETSNQIYDVSEDRQAEASLQTLEFVLRPSLGVYIAEIIIS